MNYLKYLTERTIVAINEIVIHNGSIFLLFVILIKLFVLGSFSSDFQDELFIPFINWYMEHSGNPWQAVDDGLLSAEFPYPPFMLYLLAPFYWLANQFANDQYFLSNLIRGIPLAVADFVILVALYGLSKADMRKLFIFYFLSPIILFSTYIHHQLDIIPIAILLISFSFFAKQYFATAGLFIGMALATKHHVVAVLPFMVIYMYQRQQLNNIIRFIIPIVVTFILLLQPFVLDYGFWNQVFFNKKQQHIFDSTYELGGNEIFIPIFVMLLIYMSFLSFRKINLELLISFSTIIFTSFIFLINPSPGWYVWIYPFLAMLIIKSNKASEGYFILLLLSIFYLGYFIFYHDYELSPINFLGKEVALFSGVESEIFKNITYTTLQAVLFYCAFFVYKVSVRSNSIYKKNRPFLIGIGGDSSSGKSTCNSLISKIFKDGLLQIEGDGDHKWERGNENWQTFTHLNPKANYLHRQAEDLYSLKNWKDIKRVDYDHKNGNFTSQYLLKPRDFVLISGLHPFYLPISRSCLDLKIYMDPDESLRRFWKISRDTAKRGYTTEKVLAQIESRINDAVKYIHPQRKYADLIFSFFPLQEISIGSAEKEVSQGLSIELEASIHLEVLFEAFTVDVDWDYSEDMRYQSLKFIQEPLTVDFEALAYKMIPSIDELVYEPVFEKGYNGLMQFIILLCISHKMREEGSK